MHTGIKPQHIRYSTITLHLHHGHGYVTPTMLENSKRLREKTRREKSTWASIGVNQWMKDDLSPRLAPNDWLIQY
jgi:hypothetical protein